MRGRESLPPVPGYRRRVADPADSENEELHDAHPRPTGQTLSDAVGGPLGVAESTLPFVAFTIAYVASGQDRITVPAIIALAISAVLAAVRLYRRESIQYAISGVVGVAIGAFVAARTGNASGFFLPGLLTNAGWLVLYLGSILVRRPLIGLVLSRFTGEDGDWRANRKRLRLYTLASWIWVGVFATRLAIQVPLYLSDSVGPARGGEDRHRPAAVRGGSLRLLSDPEADPRRGRVAPATAAGRQRLRRTTRDHLAQHLARLDHRLLEAGKRAGEQVQPVALPDDPQAAGIAGMPVAERRHRLGP